VLVDYDPRWSDVFVREADRIRMALAHRALQIDHVGSTAVPGLAAKPIIDIVFGVPDSADEAAYVPDLEACRYGLRHREPHWHEHWMFNGNRT
jgi:GrpB-like predicted nucleotidyltransferase (UPF0157 family)